MAYERIEPFGTMHLELLAGIIAREIANKNAMATPVVPAQVTDFMPSHQEQPEDMAQKILADIQIAKEQARNARHKA